MAFAQAVKWAFFDLDHTLLQGDSDVLWCQFLMAHGVLDRNRFEPLNLEMERAYRAGEVSAQAFCGFFVATLAGRSAAQWAPLRQRYLEEAIVPRLPARARQAVAQHQAQGHRVVLSTATNRFLCELTALHLGVADLIATECEFDARQCFTGRVAGVLNMREGKVSRAREWLHAQGHDLAQSDITFYSDSINDLPLLCAVKQAIAVDPDAALRSEALARGWPVISFKEPQQ